MKQILRGAGAFALALTLAACGGAPATPGASTGGTSTTGVTSPTSAAGTTGTSEAGTTGTSAAGTTGTSEAGTTGTSAAGTTGTSEAGTSATSAAGTTGTSAAGTTGTSEAGTTGTTGTATAGAGAAVLSDLASDPRFSTLSGLLMASGLGSQLEALGPFTLFAPTNDAFAALPSGTLDTLAQNPSLLQEILLYHVATGAIRSSDITGDTTAPTAAGEDLTITASGGTVTVNGTADVVEADITAGQGVIHAIDEVLVPPGVALGS